MSKKEESNLVNRMFANRMIQCFNPIPFGSEGTVMQIVKVKKKMGIVFLFPNGDSEKYILISYEDEQRSKKKGGK